MCAPFSTAVRATAFDPARQVDVECARAISGRPLVAEARESAGDLSGKWRPGTEPAPDGRTLLAAVFVEPGSTPDLRAACAPPFSCGGQSNKRDRARQASNARGRSLGVRWLPKPARVGWRFIGDVAAVGTEPAPDGRTLIVPLAEAARAPVGRPPVHISGTASGDQELSRPTNVCWSYRLPKPDRRAAASWPTQGNCGRGSNRHPGVRWSLRSPKPAVRRMG